MRNSIFLRDEENYDMDYWFLIWSKEIRNKLDSYIKNKKYISEYNLRILSATFFISITGESDYLDMDLFI